MSGAAASAADPSPDLVGVLAGRWADLLGAWAIPDDILRQAPESPWGFPTGLFADVALAAFDESPSPSRLRAVEALSGGGTVLDVGAGAGAASLALVPPANLVVAVDDSGDMLDAFDAIAGGRSVPHVTVVGRWPDVAGHIDTADLVVCHHVVYNVADLVPFIEALHSHAHRRVVVELTEAHPQAELNPLWRELHGIERPQGPGADDVVALLWAMGLAVEAEHFVRPALWARSDRAQQVAFARRRLCLGPERDAEIDRLLPSTDRRLVTLWWDRVH